MRTAFLILMLMFLPGAVLAQTADPLAATAPAIVVVNSTSSQPFYLSVDPTLQAHVMDATADTVTTNVPLSGKQTVSSIKVIAYVNTGKVTQKTTASCKIQAGLTTTVTITEVTASNGNVSWTITSSAPM